MSLVVDASLVVAALVDGSAAGDWAMELLAGEGLAAPALLPVEVASVLRRSVAQDVISADLASQAHADVLDLRLQMFPYRPFGPRVWELRHNLTTYDAWYVALAEALDVPLATFDLRLSRAEGPLCTFTTPPSPG